MQAKRWRSKIGPFVVVALFRDFRLRILCVFMVFIKAVTIFQRKPTFSKTNRVSIKMTAMNLIKVWLFLSKLHTFSNINRFSIQMTVVNFTNVYFFPNRRPPISQIEHGSKNGPPNTYFILKNDGFWLGAGGTPGKARRRPQTGGTPNQGPQVSPNERGSSTLFRFIDILQT